MTESAACGGQIYEQLDLCLSYDLLGLSGTRDSVVSFYYC